MLLEQYYALEHGRGDNPNTLGRRIKSSGLEYEPGAHLTCTRVKAGVISVIANLSLSLVVGDLNVCA
ncbi:hypothetical protein CBM2629_A20016 [Cupriavidus taiwanensis]|nr:hypothetical protein CBM2629_A20016 [Cupriavidus taiwanensis]